VRHVLVRVAFISRFIFTERRAAHKREMEAGNG